MLSNIVIESNFINQLNYQLNEIQVFLFYFKINNQIESMKKMNEHKKEIN
jgi:hypothetical protein